MKHSKTYIASWVLTWLTLQATRSITIAGAGIKVWWNAPYKKEVEEGR